MIVPNHCFSSLLEGTMTDGFYHSKEEAIQVLVQLASNYNARKQILSFFESSYDDVVTHFGNNDPIKQTIAALSRFISSKDELDEVGWVFSYLSICICINTINFGFSFSLKLALFIGTHGEDLDSFFMAYRLLIQNNIAWIDEFGKPMQQYFKLQNTPEPTPNKGPALISQYVYVVLLVGYSSLLI